MTDTKTHMTNSKGHMVPIALVGDMDKLEDQMVNKIVGFADDLSAQITRFKGHTFDDVTSFGELLADEYGVTKGGKKGNVTFTSYDGCRRVEVSIADNIVFGPQLQVAKDLIDECIEEWSDGSRDEIKALVNHAFDVEKEGTVNRSALYSLRRMKIENDKWQRAMQAITDSVRVIGTKSYVRIYKRATAQDKWVMVQLNIASA